MADPPTNESFKQTVVPTNSEIFGWIKDLVGFSPRRTGTDGLGATASYVADHFTESGVDNVRVETGPALCWSMDEWSLTIDGRHIPSFAAPHTGESPDRGEAPIDFHVEAELVYVGDRETFDDIDVDGKIVLADIVHPKMPLDALPKIAGFVYDPDETIAEANHVDPFSERNFPTNLIAAMRAGAVGFIGNLINYIDSPYWYNERYPVPDGHYVGLPGIWVSRTEGRAIRQVIQASKAGLVAAITLSGEYKIRDYHAVVGVLPGTCDETIIVQSHHDSTFDGAVQDGSGTACLLALARYFGRNPRSERTRNLLFLSMDTHWASYEAHHALSARLIGGDDDRNVVAAVSVEHIGLEMNQGADGEALMSQRPETRLLITSPTFHDIVDAAVKDHDYRRTARLDTAFFAGSAEGVPTDLWVPNAIAGVPIVSLISAPVYLYDKMDTLDKVAVDELNPSVRLMASLVEQIDARGTAELETDHTFL